MPKSGLRQSIDNIFQTIGIQGDEKCNNICSKMTTEKKDESMEYESASMKRTRDDTSSLYQVLKAMINVRKKLLCQAASQVGFKTPQIQNLLKVMIE